jgi:hypothetical protein
VIKKNSKPLRDFEYEHSVDELKDLEKTRLSIWLTKYAVVAFSIIIGLTIYILLTSKTESPSSIYAFIDEFLKILTIMFKGSK